MGPLGFSELWQNHSTGSWYLDSHEGTSWLIGPPGGRCRTVASAFLGGEPKVQWDSLPFQPPKPTDIVTKIEAGDQEELPEPEPEDGRVVQPPGPPMPSAISSSAAERLCKGPEGL
eukprot:s2524_g2.t1